MYFYYTLTYSLQVGPILANRIGLSYSSFLTVYESRFKDGFNEVRKRSQSAGPGKRVSKDESFDRGPKSPKLRGEDDGSDGEEKPKKPSASELRCAQYEKPLEKGHRTTIKKKEGKDLEKLAMQRSEKKERSAVLKEKMVKMIESGRVGDGVIVMVRGEGEVYSTDSHKMRNLF